MNKTIKKLYMNTKFVVGAFMIPCVSALAQDSNAPQNTDLDTSSVIAHAAEVEKGLVELIRAIAPFVISVILAVLAAVLIYKVVRWLIRAFSGNDDKPGSDDDPDPRYYPF